MNRQYGALSGIAILLITLNHAIHFGLLLDPVEGGWLKLLIVLQALGGFAVPAFLFVSGAFMAYAAGQLTATLVKANTIRILSPYVIWSSVFYFYSVWWGHVPSASLPSYGKALLVGYPYHFVPLLLFWYLVSGGIAAVGRRHGIALLAAIAGYQALLVTARVGQLPDAWYVWRPPVLFTTLSEWAIYFPLGFVLTLHNLRLRVFLRRARWRVVALTGVIFSVGILDAFGIAVAPWARFVAPLPLMFALPVVDRDAIPLSRLLEWLGRRAYGIYLVHFLILSVTVNMARPLGGRTRSGFVVFLLFVVGLGGTLALMEAIGRTGLLRRNYRYLFGAAPAHKSRSTPVAT